LERHGHLVHLVFLLRGLHKGGFRWLSWPKKITAFFRISLCSCVSRSSLRRLPGRGKTHFLAALGRELILRHSKKVLFRPTFKPVAQLLAAKRDLRLEAELKKLNRFDVLILDDIVHVRQNREGMEVLFTLLAERYERRSLLLSSNLVFSQWDQIFKDPMTTMAAWSITPSSSSSTVSASALKKHRTRRKSPPPHSPKTRQPRPSSRPRVIDVRDSFNCR
jgi:hypothetical protein